MATSFLGDPIPGSVLPYSLPKLSTQELKDSIRYQLNETSLDDLFTNIDYGQAIMNASTAIGQTLASTVPGKAGIALSKGVNSVPGVIQNVKNLKKIGDLKKLSDGKGYATAQTANIAGIAGAASDLFRGFMPEKSEYLGDSGNVTSVIDQTYDTISDAAMAFGPVGMVVGGAMKAGAFLGDGFNALGGGTDGMTTQDAILGSSLFNWNIGLINGFGGKKADTITKNQDVFENIGSSYTGTGSKVDQALTKSGKKYGLFSGSARKKANKLINQAKTQQSIMEGISDEATDRFALRNSMSAINGNRRAFSLYGGYDQSAVRAGRHGLSIKNIITAKRIISKLRFQENQNTNSLENNLQSDNRNQSQEINFNQENIIRTPESFKEGGIIEVSFDNIPEEYFESYTIEEVPFESVIPEFRDGGTMNVIPEGALHARLHHMENAETLTKKGIPVVTEKENGELEQQAEIEREEIIFRLEVTQKLEELQKKFHSEEISQKEKDLAAIEAGKLLVDEILNNTIDNTGLLTNIN